MKLATPLAVLVGAFVLALSVTYSAIQRPHYQIVGLTEGRIARLDQRTGAIDYCSVRVTDGDRSIRCVQR